MRSALPAQRVPQCIISIVLTLVAGTSSASSSSESSTVLALAPGEWKGCEGVCEGDERGEGWEMGEAGEERGREGGWGGEGLGRGGLGGRR